MPFNNSPIFVKKMSIGGFIPSCNSTDPWRPLGKFLDLYVLPAICLSGLFLNIACIIVFVQRKTVIIYFSSTISAFHGASPSRKLSPETCSERTASPEREKANWNGNGRDRSRLSSSGNGHLENGQNQRCRRKNGRTQTTNSLTPILRTQQARPRSHPLVPVLIVLCCCDSLQLLFSLLVLYLPALHDHLEMDPIGIVAQIAYLATGGLAGGLLAANCASIWTICFISLQRHRAIVRPLSTISASKSASHLPLFLIAICALLFNLPVWFEFRWSIARIPIADGQQYRSLLIHQRSALAQNEEYRFMMHKVLYPVCVYLIPLLLISFLNIRILAFIHSSARLRELTVGGSATHHRRRIAKERRSVWLLISIVLLFFLCHTGGLIIRFVDLRKHGNEPCFVFAKDFVNFLFNVNSFANPMLYFFFTKQFRDLRTTWASGLLRASTITAAAGGGGEYTGIEKGNGGITMPSSVNRNGGGIYQKMLRNGKEIVNNED